MDSRYTLITQGWWWQKILKAKHDRKGIKVLAAKKTSYVKVNTLSGGCKRKLEMYASMVGY